MPVIFAMDSGMQWASGNSSYAVRWVLFYSRMTTTVCVHTTASFVPKGPCRVIS